MYRVIGLMSGTSLDGIDIAYCHFTKQDKQWGFQIEKAETLPYSQQWKDELQGLCNASSFQLMEVHARYGRFLGEVVRKFIQEYHLKPDFISSHGHTVFHQPKQRITVQIGAGSHLAAVSGYPVVTDFRSLDVALGGQGAPLVPIGDKYLFSSFGYCLNLGGFANISFDNESKRVGFDICPLNSVLNYLAEKVGKPYDYNGSIAKSGSINVELLHAMNRLPYYSMSYPKSLGIEWVSEYIIPAINAKKLSPQDLLRTFTEHFAIQISNITNRNRGKKILLSGGGTRNEFFVERLQALIGHQLIIPEPTIIDFKEALLFAFLGVLRIRGEVNCLASVTGASRDSCSGAIYST
ncbi:MAG: anhydro-N-acetylmuramic acid kinase [Bacteroidales bacterium]|nr:anhydro-N-acetylmuramic acid kinase [Bacteroidales bacterium]